MAGKFSEKMILYPGQTQLAMSKPPSADEFVYRSIAGIHAPGGVVGIARNAANPGQNVLFNWQNISGAGGLVACLGYNGCIEGRNRQGNIFTPSQSTTIIVEAHMVGAKPIHLCNVLAAKHDIVQIIDIFNPAFCNEYVIKNINKSRNRSTKNIRDFLLIQNQHTP